MDYHSIQDDNPGTLQIAMAVDTSPGTVVMLLRLAKVIHKRSTDERLGLKLRQLLVLSYLPDRRRNVVAITDEGRTALERAERAQEEIGDELLSALSDEERATMRSLLSRVVT